MNSGAILWLGNVHGIIEEHHPNVWKADHYHLKLMETSKSRGDENKLRVIWSFSFTYQPALQDLCRCLPTISNRPPQGAKNWKTSWELENLAFSKGYIHLERSVLLRSKPAMLRSVRSRHLLPWCWWWWCQFTCYQSSKRWGLGSKKCFLDVCWPLGKLTVSRTGMSISLPPWLALLRSETSMLRVVGCGCRCRGVDSGCGCSGTDQCPAKETTARKPRGQRWLHRNMYVMPWLWTLSENLWSFCSSWTLKKVWYYRHIFPIDSRLRRLKLAFSSSPIGASGVWDLVQPGAMKNVPYWI